MREFPSTVLQTTADRVSLDLPDGLPERLLGLYTCQSDMSAIQHYIVNSKSKGIERVAMPVRCCYNNMGKLELHIEEVGGGAYVCHHVSCTQAVDH